MGTRPRRWATPVRKNIRRPPLPQCTPASASRPSRRRLSGCCPTVKMGPGSIIGPDVRTPPPLNGDSHGRNAGSLIRPTAFAVQVSFTDVAAATAPSHPRTPSAMARPTASITNRPCRVTLRRVTGAGCGEGTGARHTDGSRDPLRAAARPAPGLRPQPDGLSRDPPRPTKAADLSQPR